MASLLHDDVLDDADTRRGIGSLNFVMGNKVVFNEHELWVDANAETLGWA